MAQTQIIIGELLEDATVLRVELDSALKIFCRFIPASLPSVNIAGRHKRPRLVRQTLLCQTKFVPSAVVIEITPVQMLGESKMRFAGIWKYASQRLDCRVRHSQPRRSVICTSKVEQIVSVGQLIICKRKGWIVLDRLVQQANGVE